MTTVIVLVTPEMVVSSTSMTMSRLLTRETSTEGGCTFIHTYNTNVHIHGAQAFG